MPRLFFIMLTNSKSWVSLFLQDITAGSSIYADSNVASSDLLVASGPTYA